MFLNIKNSIAFTILGSSLLACTGSTNPETANLFDNIKNLESGEYDRQIKAKDDQAAAIIANNQAANKRIATLKSTSASNSKNISAMRGQIASARAQAQATRQQIGSDSAKLAKLNSYERQISAIEADVSGGGDPSVGSRELRNVVSAMRTLARS